MSSATTQRLTTAIREVMDLVCELPIGGIGPDGYTTAELQEAANCGECVDGNAVHDIGQRIYRILEDALSNDKAQLRSEAE